MHVILALSGSLRTGSSNTAILAAAKKLIASHGISLQLYEKTLADLPYFNPDLDREGMSPPTTVQAFRNAIARADAVLISTPEYAHGIPGVLKNALDWLVSDPNFVGKRIGIFMGSASDGNYAKDALIEVLKTMSANVLKDAVINIPGSRVKSAESDSQLSNEILRAVQALLR